MLVSKRNDVNELTQFAQPAFLDWYGNRTQESQTPIFMTFEIDLVLTENSSQLFVNSIRTYTDQNCYLYLGKGFDALACKHWKS